MNLYKILFKFYNLIINKKSNLRIFLRVLKEILFNLSSIKQRLNLINLKNFSDFNKISFLCPICENYSKPVYDFPNLKIRETHRIGLYRETLQCRHCNSSMRQRTLALKLLDIIYIKTKKQFSSIKDLSSRGIPKLKIYDTDNFSAISEFLRKDPNYIRSSYYPNLKSGHKIAENYFNINLENIYFDDNSFDIILSSEVMEHVRLYQDAHREIKRILRNKGTYIFTVPYVNEKNNINLIDCSGDEDIFLCEPHYHGDPLNKGEGILAYRIFGREIFSEFSSLDLNLDFHILNDKKHLVIKGDVFVAEK